MGRDGGYTARVADACVIIPTVHPDTDHTALGGLSGDRVAPARVAPVAAAKGDEVGIDSADPMKRAVFLDRDGVINEAVVQRRQALSAGGCGFGANPSRAQPRRWRGSSRRGFLLLVVTNQPDVARGKQTREAVEGINHRLRRSCRSTTF